MTTTTAQPLTTGALLGRFHKDLLEAGLHPQVADRILIDTAHRLIGDGDVTVSTDAVTA